MSHIIINKNEVVNFDNVLSINDKTRNEIEAEIKKYLTPKNLNKYIIYQDSDIGAQVDEYKARKIINEGNRSNMWITSRCPLATKSEVLHRMNSRSVWITLSDEYYVSFLPDWLTGGKPKKMNKTKKINKNIYSKKLRYKK
jgi:hypothetical protein